jgi:hypothetical protein
MIIIGCDYHPAFQQIAFVDTDTGELQEGRLQHREEAERFYRDLAAQGMKVRVGMEAGGHACWFERLLAELNLELWIGDAAEIRAKRVRKQKKFQRRTIAQRGMQALLVVDFLQELPNQSLGFLEVAILGAVDFFVFESLDETLCLGIVVRRSIGHSFPCRGRKRPLLWSPAGRVRSACGLRVPAFTSPPRSYT